MRAAGGGARRDDARARRRRSTSTLSRGRRRTCRRRPCAARPLSIDPTSSVRSRNTRRAGRAATRDCPAVPRSPPRARVPDGPVRQQVDAGSVGPASGLQPEPRAYRRSRRAACGGGGPFTAVQSRAIEEIDVASRATTRRGRRLTTAEALLADLRRAGAVGRGAVAGRRNVEARPRHPPARAGRRNLPASMRWSRPTRRSARSRTRCRVPPTARLGVDHASRRRLRPPAMTQGDANR